MPELTEAEQGQPSRQGSGNRSSMTINKELQANKTRVGSAKYYDVASALLGKGKADLEELFLNAARVGILFKYFTLPVSGRPVWIVSPYVCQCQSFYAPGMELGGI